MLRNKNHNLSCEFAEQIVAYIYDEATAAERREFETHLLDCFSCADEIAGFGLVRSSIGEWRKEDVFVSETPALDIPQLRPVAVSSEGSSWIDSLRKFFSFSPMWAGGFAALIIALGLVWLFYDNSKIDTLTAVAPIVEQKPVEIPKEENEFVNPKVENPVNISQTEKQFEQKTVTPKNQIVKAVNKPKMKSNPAQSKLHNSMADNKVNKNNNFNNVQRKDVPKLVEITEDEDKTLRLSELFDEIGSSN